MNKKYISLILLTVFILTGCLLPVDNTTLSTGSQDFKIYTMTGSQDIRLQCRQWFWYAGWGTDPRWNDDYDMGWVTMETGITSSTALNPNQTYKGYRGTINVSDMSDHAADISDFIGCTSAAMDVIEIRPQVKANGVWSNWLTMDQNGWYCMSDDSQHSDDPNDPNYPVRAVACQNGQSNNYDF